MKAENREPEKNAQAKEEITMTTQEIIALAKERLGNDIAEQEAQDYIDGKAAIPDDALDTVSGGAATMYSPRGGKIKCPYCLQIVMANPEEDLDAVLEAHIHSYHRDKV